MKRIRRWLGLDKLDAQVASLDARLASCEQKLDLICIGVATLVKNTIPPVIANTQEMPVFEGTHRITHDTDVIYEGPDNNTAKTAWDSLGSQDGLKLWTVEGNTYRRAI